MIMLFQSYLHLEDSTLGLLISCVTRDNSSLIIWYFSANSHHNGSLLMVIVFILDIDDICMSYTQIIWLNPYSIAAAGLGYQYCIIDDSDFFFPHSIAFFTLSIILSTSNITLNKMRLILFPYLNHQVTRLCIVH